jgi:glycosyltransferase involved in cell wall biosynthesis
VDVMRHMNRERFVCHFATLSGLAGELDHEIQRLGGTVNPCPLKFGFQRRFRQLIRDLHIDVVHSHVHHFSGYVLRCAYQASVPVRIAHFRNTEAGARTWRQWLIQDPLMRYWISQHATHIIGNGRGSLECSWRGWESDPRCTVIHNGLDTTAFVANGNERTEVRQEFGWNHDTKLVIHVGRMAPQKNHRRLIRIVARLMQDDRRVCCLIVGKPNDSVVQDILHVVKQFRLESRLAVTGVRNDVPRLLHAADLMIFPSVHEGVPGAVLEACAVGLPVLGSAIPGIREIAGHFSMVRFLELDQPDEAWTAKAMFILKSSQPLVPARASKQFEVSPYHLSQCIRAHQIVWEGASASLVDGIYSAPRDETGTPGLQDAA